MRNRFWGLVSVRNRFWAPPPAKADIATAILTNVIEHLVLLLPPNKHAFTAKAVWADFFASWLARYGLIYVFLPDDSLNWKLNKLNQEQLPR